MCVRVCVRVHVCAWVREVLLVFFGRSSLSLSLALSLSLFRSLSFSLSLSLSLFLYSSYP